MLVIETVILCSAFYVLCFLGTGTDEKNLRNYRSYCMETELENGSGNYLNQYLFRRKR